MTHDGRHNDHTSGPDELPGLPPELRALDRELLSMEISERESFGPELEAELAEAWKEMPQPGSSRPRIRTRAALAAGLATLLLATLGVPPARAGLARFLVAVQEGATEVLNLPAAVEEPEVSVQPPPGVLQDESSGFELPPAPPLARPTEETGDAGYTVPRLADRAQARELIRSFYPDALQEEGTGGSVRLLLWLDTRGRVAEAHVEASSGVPELDRAALAAAPALRFSPATEDGRATGTWLEFDLRFGSDPEPLPGVATLAAPETGQVGQSLDIQPEWISDSPYEPPAPRGARDMLREAMSPESADWDQIDEILTGGPPTGPLSLRWREDATGVLEEAILRDPSNPVPFLALARIRHKQGLRTDARRLYDRGIDRIMDAGGAVPSRVAADLHFERAAMIREGWLPWRRLGEMPTAALQNTACARGPNPPSSQRYASSEIAVAWNFLCPEHFDRLLATRFEPLEPLRGEDREEMLVSLYDAVDADPGHVEANTELLLLLAEEGRWSELLEGAHYFLSGSSQHPHAQLLLGIALHRLGRSQDASVRFHQALAQLPPAEVETIRDITPLLEPEEARRFAELDAPSREEAVRTFWAPLDPLLTTAVNEREVEHLARAAYAFLRFEGADSDAGRVWVRYGEPQRVRAVRSGPDHRTEFWDYGWGPDLTFRRPAIRLDPTLTGESERYLANLREVFPHRYAPSASEILPLTSQRARFRGKSGSGLEMEIHTRIPGELVTEYTDSLELGVFLLSSSGMRWTVERRRVEAEPEGDVHLRVPVRRDANRVVLELYDPDTGRAAALRTPVAAGELAAVEDRVQISDVLLVQAAQPYHEGALRRTASWIKPWTGPGIPETDEVGALFEIYDLPRGTVHYELRVVLEDLETGERRALGFKPVGEVEFRSMWQRSRRSPGQIGEYLTLDTRGVESGSYLLRIEMTVPDGELTVEQSRALNVG